MAAVSTYDRQLDQIHHQVLIIGIVHNFCFFCKTGFALDLNIEMMLGIEMKFSKIHSIHIPLRQILLGAT